MTSDQSEIEELLASWEEFDLGLRMREGLSENSYERLRRALRLCAEAWAHSESISRIAANVLVDIFPATESNVGIYEADTAARIQDIAYELLDLVHDCVGIDKS